MANGSIVTQSDFSDPFTPRDELVQALIGQESGGQAGAKGKVGEVGLMQIRPETAAQYGVRPEQLADPTTNRQTGTRYLSDLLKRYKGNEFLALVAYNSGPGRVDKGQLLPQSVKYAANVLRKAGSAKAPDAAPTSTEQSSKIPMLMGQQEIPAPPTNVQEIPSMWSRVQASLKGGLEGTAEAAEGPPEQTASVPPPPAGFSAPVPFAPTAAAPSAAPTPTAAPVAPPGFSPPQQFKPSFSMGPTGLHVGMTAIEPSAQERQSLDQNIAVMNQLDRAEKAFGEVEKHPEYFSAKEQNLDYLRYFHSRVAKNLSAMGMMGATPPPEVQTLLDSVGQLQAMLARGYMGGRIGAKLLAMLSPHMPQPGDSLEAIGMRLHDLGPTLQSAYQILRVAQSNPDAADQMITQMGGTAATGKAGAEPPPPPAGFK